MVPEHRVEVKNVMKGGGGGREGMTWVRLIVNKEILTQQYNFCCKFKAIISENLMGGNRNDQSVLRLKIWRMGRRNEENPISFPFQKNIYVKKIPNEKILGKVTKNFGTVYNVCSVTHYSTKYTHKGKKELGGKLLRLTEEFPTPRKKSLVKVKNELI